ncbi:MAG: ComF family protein [Arenimonas sp.]
MQFVDRLRNALNIQWFPNPCRLCGEEAGPATAFCGECLAGFPEPPPVLALASGTVHAAFLYEAPVDGLIQNFKFREDLGAGRHLARLALPVLAAGTPQALLPIPLHVSRLRQRGFNQSLELARCWSRGTGIPVFGRALVRARATAVQSGLKGAERAANVQGAFRAVGLLPAHVALVDDVYTTGATCAAAAEVLLAAGVRRVDVWCLARVP